MKTTRDLYICRNCKSPLGDDDLFCGDCGASRETVDPGNPSSPTDDPVAAAVCRFCSKPLNDSDEFCGACGKRVEENSSKAPPPVPPVGTLSYEPQEPPHDPIQESPEEGIVFPPRGDADPQAKSKLLIYLLTGVIAVLSIIVLVFALSPRKVLDGPAEILLQAEPTPTIAPSFTPIPESTASPVVYTAEPIDTIPPVTPAPAVQENSSATELEALVLEGENRYFTREELEWRTKYDLTVLRNGMFALSGKIFSTPSLKRFFGACSWYSPNEKDDGTIRTRFTKYQAANVKLILSLEREFGYR